MSEAAAPTETKAEAAPKTFQKPLVKGARVVVTGGSGFLGSAVDTELSLQGAMPYVVSRRTGYDCRSEAEVLQAMLVVRPTHVVHLAAPPSGSAPADLIEQGLQMGISVVRAAAIARAHLTLVVDWPKSKTGYDYHEALLMLANAYAADAKLSCSSVFMPPVFGPGDRRSTSPMNGIVDHAILEAAQRALVPGSSTPELPWSGKGEFFAIYVRDAAREIVQGVSGISPCFVLPDRIPVADAVLQARRQVGLPSELRWKETGSVLGSTWDFPHRDAPSTPLADAVRETVQARILELGV